MAYEKGGQFGQGIEFYLKVGTGTKTKIAKLHDIPLPEMERDTLDVTSHDSDVWREFIGGLKNGGTMAVAGRFIDDDQVSVIWDAFNSNDPCEIEVHLNNDSDTRFTADAFCVGFHPSTGNVEEALEFSATFQITGEPEMYDGEPS